MGVVYVTESILCRQGKDLRKVRAVGKTEEIKLTEGLNEISKRQVGRRKERTGKFEGHQVLCA
jgi:hypothetical protein